MVRRAVCRLRVRFGIEQPRRRPINKRPEDGHAFNALLRVGRWHDRDEVSLVEECFHGRGQKDLGGGF